MILARVAVERNIRSVVCGRTVSWLLRHSPMVNLLNKTSAHTRPIPPAKLKNTLIERLADFCFIKLKIDKQGFCIKPSSRVQISISRPL